MNSFFVKRISKNNEGWFYSENFDHWQKVNNKVYVYVRPQLFGRWIVQMYIRGTASVCSLEARIDDGVSFQKLFELGEIWMKKYKDDISTIEQDVFYPFQENWLGKNIEDVDIESVYKD